MIEKRSVLNDLCAHFRLRTSYKIRRPNERINAMTETTIGLEQTEQKILALEVSDEALEAAAGTVREKAADYTLAACSGLSVCPA